MMNMNRTPTPAELGGLGTLIEFVVALAKDPAAFDAVINPIKAQIEELNETRKAAEAEQSALTVSRQGMQAQIAELNEATHAEAEKRRSASERIEQAKAALAQLDARRAEVSATEKALAAREAEFSRTMAAAAAENAKVKADLDKARAELRAQSDRLTQETDAAEAARVAYEQKLAALKAAVGG